MRLAYWCISISLQTREDTKKTGETKRGEGESEKERERERERETDRQTGRRGGIEVALTRFGANQYGATIKTR